MTPVASDKTSCRGNDAIIDEVSSPVAWPLLKLRVVTPRLTLRLPLEEELVVLADRAAGHLLSPEQTGFMGGWAQLPSPQFEHNFMTHHLGLRRDWKASDWSLQLGVYPKGCEEPVGIVGAWASEFARLRSAQTGSWLLPQWRGRGLGSEARAALLHLLFAGLGAREARSRSHRDNTASHAASRGLGYRPDGTEFITEGGQTSEVLRLLLRKRDWAHYRRSDITISGLSGCAELLGL